jgi:hypothetical protein
MSNVLEVSDVSDNKDIDIKEIIKDIERGDLTSQQIIEKHNINTYKYNQILKLAEIKKPYCINANNKKPKNTKFKRMLYGSDKEQIDLEKTDETFDKEGFIGDCKRGLKISELMEKYGLSLYQVRELRKRCELKTK